ncbi:MAG: hypothetical protein HWN66_19985 [Candidatus Helarchaeota archaeon]|nr:hypothetical protein [Candidatus Helarchaeota archaeon]
MVKLEKFYNFIERILESSHLQIAAGAIQQAFREEIFLNAEEIHRYLKRMKILLENWKKESKTDFISRFIEDLGSILFKTWLSEIFSFELKQIEVNCPRGPSSVDFLLGISYYYNKNELKIIRDLLIKHDINSQEDEVARTLFVEAIKSITDTFSKIIGQPYKIFTSNVDLIMKRGVLQILYEGAGRVIE